MKKGDTIPSFELKDDKGDVFRSDDHVGKHALVIYFYPKDETKGCTLEACSFRDAYQDFQDAGAEVVGISSDSIKRHQKFRQNHRLPFILLSDPGRKVAKQFGVKGDLLGLIPGRETFIFDKNGTLVHSFRSQMRFDQHVKESLQALREA